MLTQARRREIEAFIADTGAVSEVGVKLMMRDLYEAFKTLDDKAFALVLEKHQTLDRAAFKREVFKSAIAGICAGPSKGDDHTHVTRALIVAEQAASEFFDEKQPRPLPTSIPGPGRPRSGPF